MCCSHDYISIVIKHGSVGLSDTFVILLNFDESLIQDGTKEHLKKLQVLSMHVMRNKNLSEKL